MVLLKISTQYLSHPPSYLDLTNLSSHIALAYRLVAARSIVAGDIPARKAEVLQALIQRGVLEPPFKVQARTSLSNIMLEGFIQIRLGGCRLEDLTHRHQKEPAPKGPLGNDRRKHFNAHPESELMSLLEQWFAGNIGLLGPISPPTPLLVPLRSQTLPA